MTGSVLQLYIKTQHGRSMTAVDRLTLEAGKGIVGDVQHGRSLRQVLLMDQETLDEFGLRSGQVKENVTLQGLPLKGLTPGTRLRLGTSLAEVTMDCEPCSFIEDMRPGLQETMVGRRGILLRVLESGIVAVGDEVWLPPLGESDDLLMEQKPGIVLE